MFASGKSDKIIHFCARRKKNHVCHSTSINNYLQNIQQNIYFFEWRGNACRALASIIIFVYYCDVIGKIPALQPGGRDSIQGGVSDFNVSPETGRVSVACALSCAFSGGGPDILLTTDGGRPALALLSILVPVKDDPWQVCE